MANRHSHSAHQGVDFPRGRWFGAFLIGLLTITAASASGQDIEREPIHYSAATPRNAVARLQERLATTKANLDFESKHGYLRSLLRALDVPESSQVLVFSKTSLQRERISPKTPRAIYFNDDVMVGFCLRGQVIEISAADDGIGTAFYTLDQAHEEKPVPQRQTESCLLCHSSSANQGFPGHLVRSLFVDWQGNPLLASGVVPHRSHEPARRAMGGLVRDRNERPPDAHGEQDLPGNEAARGDRQRRRCERDRPEGPVHDLLLPDAAQRHRRADGARTPGRHAQPPGPGGDGDAHGRCTTSARSTRRSAARPTSVPTARGLGSGASARRSSSTCSSATRRA